VCGIAGIVEHSEDREAPKVVLEAMLRTIEHRGPDDSGLHLDGPVGLGIQRLKIIDLEGGHQPMTNEDGSVWVVYNGEIYNHLSVRRTLESRGHRFRTDHSDTEAIVHAWEEWGEACVQELHGMFAFAVWDARTRTLFLARDRLGIKPLYYSLAGQRLVFASELKAILEHPGVDREVDLQSLYHYIGYEFVPGPATMFRGIRKLQPGQTLTLRNGQAELREYWDVSFEPSDEPEETHVRRIRELLGESVRKRLMADVPLGIFLSGGLDSTAVLALARQATTQPLPTFTIGYADESFSEWEYARHAARYYGTEHHEILIEPVTPALIEWAVWHLDEPMTDLSTLPLSILCREARRHATVCLSGEGGDEVFVGYDRFIASKCERLYRRLPSVVRRSLIEPLIRRLPDQEQKKGLVNVVRRFVDGAALEADGGHMRWQYFSSPEQDRQLYTEAFRGQVAMDPFAPVRQVRARARTPDPLAQELYVDLRLTMPDSVLMKVDKMSMGYALEVRVPFLDHLMVEAAAGIPSRLKFPGLRTKAIYRKAMTGLLPEEILHRGKQGYSLPLKQWLRQELREYMIDVLNASPLLQTHLNLDHVNLLIRQHLRRSHNHNHILWALLNLALWHRRFIEQSPIREG
jgi:asparagine synthase (glutamine-hydrolysing)